MDSRPGGSLVDRLESHHTHVRFGGRFDQSRRALRGIDRRVRAGTLPWSSVPSTTLKGSHLLGLAHTVPAVRRRAFTSLATAIGTELNRPVLSALGRVFNIVLR